jgi:biopolymer transport protein ExbB/biopolymer transport protein TolQ
MLVEKLLKVALLGSSWVLWLLLALSVFSIGAMIERWWYFYKHRDDIDELTEKLLGLLEAHDQEGARGLLGRSRSVEAAVLVPAMRYLDAGPDALTDEVEAQMVKIRQELERGSTLLGTLGNNAPFIGLFGTVIGVIIAFHQLGVNQASAAMGAVMGGIAEALVATGVGLFVAIPAVVAYNVIQKRVGDIEGNVTAMTKQLTALLKAQAGGCSPSRDHLAAEANLRSEKPGRGLAALADNPN